MAELDIVALVDQDFTIIKGDDKDFSFAVKNASAAAVNVTSGYKARLQARVGGLGGTQAIILDEANCLTLGNGTITASFLAAATALLNVGTDGTGSVALPYELEITKTGSPNQVKTIASGTITVQDKLVGKVSVASVTLDKSTLALEVGGATGSLTATVLPATATLPTVTWASSDTDIATVSGGTVTAVTEGTANITATADGITATCVVTVAAAEG